MNPPLLSGRIIGTPNQGTHAPGANGLPAIWQNDNAVDIATPEGTPIYAPFAGTIGSQFGAFDTDNPLLSGLRLTVFGNQNAAYLAHLSKFAEKIKPGVTVQEGQLLGYSGTANGVAHLHYALQRGNPLNDLGSIKVGKSGASIGDTSNLAGCATLALPLLIGAIFTIGGLTYTVWGAIF